ncbi:microfibril-associated glycoprotein 4-like isoform X2 [Anopheles darlingi]|uniref:microfibril-associated glycoprotein 4-like isoform X2 n=1 Tax=Anopheles darlingi TaxID=43151 RepID=UPI00210054C0|nr:microfibril-associated glycoprotein 4-like isoform X2 [Anopheles darlingi]
MYGMFRFLLAVYVVFTGSIVRPIESKKMFGEFYFEIIVSKLDGISSSMERLQTEVQRQQEEIMKTRDECLKWQTEIMSTIASKQAYEEEILTNLSLKLTELSKQQSDIAIRDNREGKYLELMARMQFGSFRSCKDIPVKVSGIFNFRAKDTLPSFRAFCEQDKHGGGWMIIHHRYDGSLNMDRNWNDYRNGFGTVGEEVWIGLERIHQMTTAQDHELLVEMIDFDGQYKYARYDAFVIGSESEGYNLKVLGGYTGTAGDSLQQHAGMKFTTKDSKNDKSNHNCARRWTGGWWFRDCYRSHLNGPYLHSNRDDISKMEWYDFHDEWNGLSYARMMIRPLR